MRNLRTKRENFHEISAKMNFRIFKNLENHYFPKLVDGYTLKLVVLFFLKTDENN